MLHLGGVGGEWRGMEGRGDGMAEREKGPIPISSKNVFPITHLWRAIQMFLPHIIQMFPFMQLRRAIQMFPLVHLLCAIQICCDKSERICKCVFLLSKQI